ncbi:cysteine synthase [Caloranaerobacter sp. TR13]|uniref:PLP-dependent cysteine synthase family protein n=1 Tax=Caloranaerobacter sp. TR13 TaxID=1302151 RepID=UPI0006D3C846|nr:cysteine synthase family protein [Caloranaerobacter sp. TR13]KPU27537.1 cysteine synthase [Caloranaerobacter sp. TR13]
MKKYIENISQIIGNTPMFKFDNKAYDIPKNVNIFAKLEYLNPGGSIKDRTVLYMLEQAEKKGIIKPGYTLLEATAGNTGIALALLGVQKGYRVIVVVPGKFSIEKQIIMRGLGAEVYSTPTKEGMEGAYRKIEELLKEIPNGYVLNQFTNPFNPEAHYMMTGPEIYDDMDGEIDVFIAGAGTGGAFSGIVKYLKEKNKNVKGVLADPVGSILGGGEYATYRIEGIGNDFIPETMDLSLVDEAIYVNDDEAYDMVRDIAAKSGLTVGSSSGANLAAAIKYAKKYKGDKEINIVTLMPDRSDRYFSKDIYGFKDMYENNED